VCDVRAVRVGPLPVNRGLELPLDTGPKPEAPEVLDQRLRGTQFLALAPRSVLNAPEQTGTGWWSLNPYVGCEFGCTYCYARYAHRYVVERARDQGRLSAAEFQDLRGPQGWEAFERRVFVKETLAQVLDRDLARFFRRRKGETPIVLGTATDPYQPAERRFRLTRTALEHLARYEGLSIGIITKSPLVTRDLDVLTRIAARSDVEICVSLITTDAKLLRAVEPRSPLPAVRLAALRKLVGAGLNAGLIVAPVLPGLTDDVARLTALVRAAKDAGARFLYAGPLRLYAGVRECFLPVLEARFPELAERYRRAYARSHSAPAAYAKALRRRIERLEQMFGLPTNDGMRDRYRPKRRPLQTALSL
jgi:DNA repair photolyase